MARKPAEYVNIEDVHVVRETTKAIQCHEEDLGLFWVPKSIIHDDSEVYKMGTEGTLIIPEWFAQKESLV